MPRSSGNSFTVFLNLNADLLFKSSDEYLNLDLFVYWARDYLGGSKLSAKISFTAVKKALYDDLIEWVEPIFCVNLDLCKYKIKIFPTMKYIIVE